MEKRVGRMNLKKLVTAAVCTMLMATVAFTAGCGAVCPDFGREGYGHSLSRHALRDDEVVVRNFFFGSRNLQVAVCECRAFDSRVGMTAPVHFIRPVGIVALQAHAVEFEVLDMQGRVFSESAFESKTDHGKRMAEGELYLLFVRRIRYVSVY